MKKHWIIYLVITLLLIVVSAAMAASGKDYQISFFTIDVGGRTSSGGVYQVSGTIGQHDAGTPLSGDKYSLIGGFWGGGFPDYFIYIPLVIR